MKSLSRIAVPLLSLWLVAWIVFSWGGIQDDALIHLRYADFLHQFHFITYDGVHASYGTSSLLYVGLLSVLRSFSSSPYLSRGVSTFFHLVLFASFAGLYLRTVRSSAARVQILSLAVLFMFALPSAVRWLDDGMETGLVLCLISLVVWWTHRLSLKTGVSPRDLLVSLLLGFLLVILRNELAIVAFFATLALTLAASGKLDAGWPSRIVRALPARAAFLVGGVLAALAIRAVMRSFLPDTALAKSHGIAFFKSSLQGAGIVLAGALIFGFGMALLWLISAAAVLLDGHARNSKRFLATLAANLLFPFVLLLSALRGQEIQGVRYLVWTFVFSIVWNLFELRWLEVVALPTGANSTSRPASLAFSGFLVLCLIALPVESRLMARVLSTRAETMRVFVSQNLREALPNQLGIATDVGYISYFTHDNICDSAGLVNGRAAAALPDVERARICISQHPGFAFVNSTQASTLARFLDFTSWSICGVYDFGNMLIPDRHYLLVRPDLVDHACRTIGVQPAPAAVALIPSVYNRNAPPVLTPIRSSPAASK